MERPDASALVAFLAPYPAEVQELALHGRAFLWDMLQPVCEIFWDATNAVCSGFTYTGRTTDNFVNLAVYSDHVTLIFPWGVRLLDPEARLKGEGKQVRHIRMKGMATLEEPYILDLIRQAQAFAPRPSEPVQPETIVRVMAGPKRRPRKV